MCVTHGHTMPYVQTALQVWVIDWLSPQGYNVRHGALQALVLGKIA